MIKRFRDRMVEVTLQRRWLLAVLNFGLASLALLAGLVDRTSISGMVDFIMFGVLLAQGLQALTTPGLLRAWHDLERNNIQVKMQAAFQEMVERHNEEISHHGEIKH